jgi:hypothetical protein
MSTRSNLSSQERVEKIKEEAVMKFEKFVMTIGDIAQANALVKTIGENINRIQLLVGYGEKDSEEEVGFQLSEEIDDMMKMISDEFKMLTIANVDIEMFRRFQNENRQTDEKEAEWIALTKKKFIEPNLQDFLYSAKKDFKQYMKEFKSEVDNIDATGLDATQLQDAKVALKQKEDADQREHREKLIEDSTDDYYHERADYFDKIIAQNDAIDVVEKIKLDKMKVSIMDIICSAYVQGQSQIVNKVKIAIKSFPAIITKFRVTTTVDSTGEEIADPYGNNSFPGIVAQLYQSYRKKSFISYTNAVIDVMALVMTETESEEKPWETFNKLDRVLGEWDKKDLFAQMTQDHFFSATYLKALHVKSKFRQTLLTDTLRFIRDGTESGELEEKHRMKEKPIFGHIRQFVEMHRKSKVFPGQKESLPERHRPPNNNWYSKHRSGNTEMAADASEITESTIEHAASAGYSGGKPAKQYTGEVFKSAGVICYDEKRRKHPYVAVLKRSSICAKCYSEQGESTQSQCQKKCFAYQCKACGYHGHTAQQCMQKDSVLKEAAVQGK